MFARGTGPPTPTEYDRAEHVEQQIIDDIAGWIS